jgi:hypothetical protein
MKSISLKIITVGVVFLLSSCNAGDKASPPTPTKPAGTAPAAQGDSVKGGQVVESGEYHMELVPTKAPNNTHLDFYLKIDATGKEISDAKVAGEVISPDGKQKPISFTYDAKGKHYVADVSDKATGAYQLKITASIGAKKADGRFKFDR